MSNAAARIPLLRFGTVLFAPSTAITEIGANPPSSTAVFFGAAIWLGLCPPLFAYIGTSLFGWRLGVEPMFLAPATLGAIALAYLALLLVGFLSTAFVAHWMAATYDADSSFNRSLALVTLVGTPLTVGSIVHLYPNAFLNVLVLVPTLIWSMYLLYRGLPALLKTEQGRGMLMASALIAYLLVAWVTLLGITAVLWSHGIGPQVAT
jgi:hypothetical protein